MQNNTRQTDDWSVTVGEISQYKESNSIPIDHVVLHSFTNKKYDMPRRDVGLLRLSQRIEQDVNVGFENTNSLNGIICKFPTSLKCRICVSTKAN